MPKLHWQEHYIPEPNSGCWIWLGAIGITGYPICCPYGKKGGQRKVHRLMYELHKGPIPDGMLACHHCDNTLCVNPDHIFIGSITDNNRDMYRKGRGRGPAKLVPQQVREIRAATGKTQVELAREFGVRDHTISRIRSGKRWARLLPHM